MKRFTLILSIALISVFTFHSDGFCKTIVFFVGGWGMTASQMESFSQSVPDSRKVKYFLPSKISELTRPWYCAEMVYDYIQRNNLAEDDLYVVAFSMGGIVTQWLLRNHPELRIRKLILVGTPIGGYKFVPPNPFFSNKFPKDLPIYVIAGSKRQNSWFLRQDNDGVVDLESALNISDENLRDVAIFRADHNELEDMPEVQTQISQWLDLGQEPPRNVIAGNTPLSPQSRNLDSLTNGTVNLPN